MVRKSTHLPTPPPTNVHTLLDVYRILVRDEPEFRAHLDRVIAQLESVDEVRQALARHPEETDAMVRGAMELKAHVRHTMQEFVANHARAMDKLRRRHEREMARMWNSFASGDEDAPLRGLCVAVAQKYA